MPYDLPAPLLQIDPQPLRLYLCRVPSSRSASGFAELPTALWARQVTPPKDAANPPHLKTTKDQGAQTQLDVSPVQVVHYACCFRAALHRLICWCWVEFTNVLAIMFCSTDCLDRMECLEQIRTT